MSCANDVAAVIVRPATTARIVANATAEMKPSSTGPPSCSASSGAAEFTPPGAARIVVGTDERRGAVAEHEREQVEDADDPDRPDDAAPRLLGRRHRVEAHQHVRQAGRAEHERERERHEVRAGSRRTAARARGSPPVTPGRPPFDAAERRDRVIEQCSRVEPVDREHPDRHHQGAADEQERLDDLHPGGALHPADQHVDDHQHADDRDRRCDCRPVPRCRAAATTSPPAPAICASR